MQYVTALLEYLNLTALLEHPRKEMIHSKGGSMELFEPPESIKDGLVQFDAELTNNV